MYRWYRGFHCLWKISRNGTRSWSKYPYRSLGLDSIYSWNVDETILEAKSIDAQRSLGTTRTRPSRNPLGSPWIPLNPLGKEKRNLSRCSIRIAFRSFETVRRMARISPTIRNEIRLFIYSVRSDRSPLRKIVRQRSKLVTLARHGHRVASFRDRVSFRNPKFASISSRKSDPREERAA